MYPDSRKTRLKQIGRVIDGKRPGEARQLLQTFLKQYPQDPEGWFLASTLMADPQRQLDTLYKVLKLDPDHQQALQRLKVLKVQQPDLKFDERFQELIDRVQPILSKPVGQSAIKPVGRVLLSFIGLIGVALLAAILTIGYLLVSNHINLVALLTTQLPPPTLLPTDTPTWEPSPIAAEAATETATEAATETTTEAATEAATKSATEMVTGTPSEMATELATEAATEMITETSTQTVTEYATELATETTTQAVTEMAAATVMPANIVAPTDTPVPTRAPSPSPTSSPVPFGITFAPLSKENLSAIMPITTLKIAGQGALLKISFGADDSHLAVANGGAMSANIWNFATNRESAVFSGSRTLDIAYDRSGRFVATTSVNDNSARVWDAATGNALYSVAGHAGAVRAVAFSPDGSLLATGAVDGTVRLWRADTGAAVATLTTGVIVDSVTFNASSSLLAAGCLDGSIQIWNVSSRQLLRTLRHSPAGSSLMYAKFFGNTLASTNGSSVILWDTSGAPVRTIATPEGSHGVALNPNLQLFALAGNDGMVRLGDVGTGHVLLTLKGADGQPVQSVSFSPDGKLLASGSLDGAIRLWAVNSASTTPASRATVAKNP